MGRARGSAGELSSMLYELRYVSMTYRSRRSGPATALRDLSLSIAPGTFVSLTGPSGAGKSTLLALLGGLARPDKGQIRFRPSAEHEGWSLDAVPEDACASIRRRHIGFVYQAFNLVPTMTATQNVALPLLFSGVKPAERAWRAKQVLERLGLHAYGERFPAELSGGQQQRVAIARALVNRPAVVLADEPTGSLDSDASDEVMKILAEIHRQDHVTIIMVTHNFDIAQRFSTNIVTMCDGRLTGQKVMS